MEQTAKFEHFVDAFFDQCFKLIDSVALLQTRDEIPSEDVVLAEDESDADGIYCHIILILCQCSPDLYDKALAKVNPDPASIEILSKSSRVLFVRYLDF